MTQDTGAMAASNDFEQSDIRRMFLDDFRTSSWVPLFHRRGRDTTFFSALVHSDQIATVLTRPGWDLRIGGGHPCMVENGGGQTAETVSYHRFGGLTRVEPLVFQRWFDQLREAFWEVSEEFRLFHNLYPQRSDLLVRINDDGTEEDSVRFSADGVHVRRSHLRQYLGARNMALVLYVDSFRKAVLADGETMPKRKTGVNQDDDYILQLTIGPVQDYSTDERTCMSGLLGKCILRGPPREQSGVWPYESAEDFPAFIIGLDGDDKEVQHTCDPDALGNIVGGNAGAPSYLTPVAFRREVLDKYRDQPERYTVEDGALWCGGLWMARIDNDRDDVVTMFLGDIGRDLPEIERRYWRSFNIAPVGGISETAFRRGFAAEFCDPQHPELVFRTRYEMLSRDVQTAQGWSFFRAPGKGDDHLLTVLPVPTTDSQPKFDEQVLVLNKLLVDLLDEKGIEAQLRSPPPDGTKGLGKLELLLAQFGVADPASIMSFPRALQALRSSGSGHAKGRTYAKALERLDLEKRAKPEAFRVLLELANDWLSKIRSALLADDRSDPS